MATIAVRVELPTYSQSFIVSVPASAMIVDVKREIESKCVGRPAASGQRLIWRGRYLSDGEQVEDIHKASDGHCVVHLSVHPSAWTAGPPTSSRVSSMSTSSLDGNFRTISSQLPSDPTFPNVNHYPEAPPHSRTQAASFISSKHWHALSVLIGQAETRDEQTEEARTSAKRIVESHGYIWPFILDEEYPPANPKSAEGLVYDVVTLDSRTYLQLRNPNAQPTPRQVHALKVLTYTFFLRTLPPPPTASFTVPPTLESVPAPHVNELLAQLGFPPLRAAGPNVNAAALQGHFPEGEAQGIMADIPVRALLAPLFMVLLRILLLLYFFTPTSKPIFGVLIVIWILYEVWTHVRIVVLRPLEDAANQRQQQRAAGNEQGNQGHGNAGMDMPEGGQLRAGDAQAAVGANGQDEAPASASQRPSPPLVPISAGFLDTLAYMRIASENTILFAPPMHPARPPTWTEKATAFASLFFVTLHPGIWNRRRRALREREGRIRTEMNAIEREEQQEGSETDRRAQTRSAFLAMHSRRSAWVKDYVVRARAGEWVEE